MRLRTRHSRYPSRGIAAGFVLGVALLALVVNESPASAAPPPNIGAGAAGPFSVLGGQSVTNKNATTMSGDIGVSPGSSITGFPPGKHNGVVASPTVADQAQTAVTTAYTNAADALPDTSLGGAALGGRALSPGNYTWPTLDLTGTLTLNGNDDVNAMYIFRTGAMTTAGASRVVLHNVNPCNVYWQDSSSATLGATSTFVGNLMTLASITVGNKAVISGRLLAMREGSVTLDEDTITQPECVLTTTDGSGTSSSGSSSTPGGGSGSSSTPGGGSGSSGVGGGSSTASGPGIPLRTTATATSTSTSTSTTSTSTSTSTRTSTTATPFTTAATTTPGGPPVLARTGSDNGALAGGATLAIVLGGAILVLARRRPLLGRHNH